MSVRNVTKLKAAMEDLLTGVGTVEQVRNNQAYVVGMVDVPYAVETTAELTALDTTVYTRARLYSSTTVFSDYIYDSAATTGVAPDSGSGFWVLGRSAQSVVAAVEFNTLADAITGTLPNGNQIVLQIGDTIKLKERVVDKLGGAYWNCVDASTVPSPNGIDQLAVSSTVVITLAIEPVMTTKMYGALHDGTTDDTAAITRMISQAQTLGFKCVSSKGGALISTAGLQFTGNITMEWEPNSVWTVEDNSSTFFDIILISGSNNRLIHPAINGNKLGHTGAASLTVNNIRVNSNSGTNFIIAPNVYNSWGHGITVTEASQLVISDMNSTSNTGRGLNIESITHSMSCPGLTYAGNNDAGGVLFKPSTASTSQLQAISIGYLKTQSNDGPGVELDFDVYPNAGYAVSVGIGIGRHDDRYSTKGFYIAPMAKGLTESINGLVSIGAANYRDSDLQGIHHEDYAGENTPLVHFSTAKVHNYNNDSSTSDNEACALSFQRLGASTNTTSLGNLHIDNLYISEDRGTSKSTYAIYAEDDKLTDTWVNTYIGLQQIQIDDAAGGSTVVFERASGLTLDDKANVLTRTITASTVMIARVEREIVNNHATAQANVTLFDLSTNGDGTVTIKSSVLATGGVRVTPATGFNILPIATTANKYVESTQEGATITLSVDPDNNAYIIENMVGTWAVEP